MGKLLVRGQMVRVIKIEEQEVKNGDRKGEKFKTALFTVADRDKHSVKDGKGGENWVTDAFYFCKAIGSLAEIIEKYFSDKDENGKLVSRRIYLELEPQQYKAKKTIDVEMKVPAEKLCAALGVACPESAKGKDATLTKKEVVEEDAFIFIVKDLKFEDYKETGDKKATVTTELEIKIDLDNLKASSDFNLQQPDSEFVTNAGSNLFTQP